MTMMMEVIMDSRIMRPAIMTVMVVVHAAVVAGDYANE